MSLAVLVDFDGTITTTDASYAVLERFAEGDWRTIEDRAYSHELTILEALDMQAKMVKASLEDVGTFLRETIEMRQGFREFALWCRKNGIHIEICSDGFDLTIEILLKHWGLDWIPWTSNHTIPSEEGWRMEFHHHRRGCPINANCKCSHLERLEGEFDPVVFVGDGTTDECVSRRAKIVFARDRLLKICQREERNCIPWQNWSEILEGILEIRHSSSIP